MLQQFIRCSWASDVKNHVLAERTPDICSDSDKGTGLLIICPSHRGSQDFHFRWCIAARYVCPSNVFELRSARNAGAWQLLMESAGLQWRVHGCFMFPQLTIDIPRRERERECQWVLLVLSCEHANASLGFAGSGVRLWTLPKSHSDSQSFPLAESRFH